VAGQWEVGERLEGTGPTAMLCDWIWICTSLGRSCVVVVVLLLCGCVITEKIRREQMRILTALFISIDSE
jgi:hypothetical protein